MPSLLVIYVKLCVTWAWTLTRAHFHGSSTRVHKQGEPDALWVLPSPFAQSAMTLPPQLLLKLMGLVA